MKLSQLTGASAFLALTALGSTASAATITVTSNADDDGVNCTLREAIASANAATDPSNGCNFGGSTDTIVVPAGTYTLTQGELSIAEDVAIVGAGSGATIIDAAGGSRIFNVNQSVGIQLTDVQLTGGLLSDGQGGAVLLDGGADLTASRVSFRNNQARTGGAIRLNFGATAAIYDSEFDGNKAENQAMDAGTGGAIQTIGTRVLVVRSYFHGNTAFERGGAIRQQAQTGDVELEVWDSLFEGNSAGLTGGAIEESFGTMTGVARIYNSTFSNNSANNGGALRIDGGNHSVYLSHCTLTQNTAAGNGGGIRLTGARLGVTNSLLASNTANTSGPDCATTSGAVIADHHNLIGDTSNCGGLDSGTNLLDATAGLVALADNGGATMTHALDDTSQARGAGDCIAADGQLLGADQRGVARTPEGACTIGAWDPYAVLGATSDEAPGENCADGGTQVQTGIDLDDDAVLDPEEVTSTTYVCKDLSGAVLVELTDETPGDNCELGGLRVDKGIDADGNGTLDSAEIDTSDYLCNGADGATGPDGEQGAAGSPGPAGGCSVAGDRSRDAGWLTLALALVLLRRRRDA